MKEIRLNFQNAKLVFEVGEDEYFIASEDVLKLLDRQRVKETFDALKPEVIYADLDTFDFISKFEAMKQKDYTLAEIAEQEGTTEKHLEDWIIERADTIRRIKEADPRNFQAAVKGCMERIPRRR